MYKLAKYLLFFSSYNDMKEILEDYGDFYKNNIMLEKPKDILKSLDKSFKPIIFISILIFLNLFTFIYLKNKYYFNIKFLLPIILNFITPFIIYKFLGKKLILISKFYNTNNKDNIIKLSLSLFYLLLYIFYFIYISCIRFSTININIIELFYLIQNILRILIIFSLILTLYFLLIKGIEYYKLFCFSYINTFVILQIDAIQNAFTTKNFFINYFIIMFIIIFINILYIMVLNKKVK